ncbi:hypothetical protein RP20_CCG012026 [Aedes albopictus]|nr:hypothetical protein RP20_CCG012026 [Aedes albopictus]
MAFLALNAAPVDDSSAATIVRQEFVRTDDGYRFEYETSDGQTRQEEGKLVTDAEGKQYMKVHGSFSYIGPDGNTYYGSYEADKDGYQFTPTEPSVGIPNSALLSLVG